MWWISLDFRVRRAEHWQTAGDGRGKNLFATASVASRVRARAYFATCACSRVPSLLRNHVHRTIGWALSRSAPESLWKYRRWTAPFGRGSGPMMFSSDLLFWPAHFHSGGRCVVVSARPLFRTARALERAKQFFNMLLGRFASS